MTLSSRADRQAETTRLSIEMLFDHGPIIANVKDAKGVQEVLASECRVVFVLFGSVLTVERIVATLVKAGKIVFVDVDLLDGFSGRDIVVRFLRERTAAHGVLSAKGALVRAGKQQGLLAIHRFFLIDSLSYRNLSAQLSQSQADAVEILPGCMPRVIGWLLSDVEVPIVAGGLVCDKDDVVAALGAGAVAVASSSPEVWRM